MTRTLIQTTTSNMEACRSQGASATPNYPHRIAFAPVLTDGVCSATCNPKSLKPPVHPQTTDAQLHRLPSKTHEIDYYSFS